MANRGVGNPEPLGELCDSVRSGTMASDSSKGFMTCVLWSVAVSVVVTLTSLAIYRFNPSCPYSFRLPLLPGGLLVWNIWGDDFASSEAFDRLAIPIAFAFNAVFGALLGAFVFWIARYLRHSNSIGNPKKAM